MRRLALALCVAVTLAAPAVSGIAFAQDPGETVESLLAAAHDAQTRKDFAAAAESYRKATELDPTAAELWANLGLMLYESGDSAAAIRSFKQAIHLNSSLYVPQLFLGIAYLASQNPQAAIPFLENAEKLDPGDRQAPLHLARAYSLLDHADIAARAYQRAIRLAPNDADAWLSLGTTYLQQVENDARLMASEYNQSAYFHLRAAETFVEEGKLVQAEEAFKSAQSANPPPSCTHAEFGIALLREKRVTEAREQFRMETLAGSHCPLLPLGIAVAELADGHTETALTKLNALQSFNPDYLQTNLALCRGVASPDQVAALATLSRSLPDHAASPTDLAATLEAALLSENVPIPTHLNQAETPRTVTAFAPALAQKFAAADEFERCSDMLKPELRSLAGTALELLASCSFYSGDFQTTSEAAQRLKVNADNRASGFYWETKADQKLAIVALVRAGEIDANSPRMHVLLGDVFRQRRRWSDAEAEYRKAVSLDPRSRSARLSLAIVLFSELKLDEASTINQALLIETPNDPEANLLAAEILVLRNNFAEAEPYLLKCEHLKPELVPRFHVLLGQVYAETNRSAAAIAEYKSGLSADEDGSIHFQLGRLYQKSGDKKAADEAFQDSKRIRHRWDDRARIALEQIPTDTSRQ
jgi:tetratricopeptide (TPR) repeat protein